MKKGSSKVLVPSEVLRQKILARIKIDEIGDCWLWQGSIHSGYGRMYWGRKNSNRAHRISYVAFGGQIPPGLTIDHLCKVKNCVNPSHLEPVTQAENSRRSFGDRWSSETHCGRGHPLTPENLYFWRSRGRTVRQCKECNRMISRRSYLRRKAQANA